MTPAEVRARFLTIVRRGIARAEQEEADHFARIRSSRKARPPRRVHPFRRYPDFSAGRRERWG